MDRPVSGDEQERELTFGAGRHRRRPSGEPPPMPRDLGRSGKLWAGVAIGYFVLTAPRDHLLRPALAVVRCARRHRPRVVHRDAVRPGRGRRPRDQHPREPMDDPDRPLVDLRRVDRHPAMAPRAGLPGRDVRARDRGGAPAGRAPAATAVRRDDPRQLGRVLDAVAPARGPRDHAHRRPVRRGPARPDPRRRASGSCSSCSGSSSIARLILAVETPSAALFGAVLGVAVGLTAFRWLVPHEVFPVTYRRTKAAHLDVGGRTRRRDPRRGPGPARRGGRSTSARSGSKARAGRPPCGSRSSATTASTRTCSRSSTR